MKNIQKYITFSIALLVSVSTMATVDTRTHSLDAYCSGNEKFVLKADTVAENFVYQWYKNNTLLTDSTRSELVVPKTEEATYRCKIDSLDPQIGNNMMGNGSFEDEESVGTWFNKGGANQPFNSGYEYFNGDGWKPMDGFYSRHESASGFYVITENAHSMWKRFVDVPADDGTNYAVFDAASSGTAWCATINDGQTGHDLQSGEQYIFSFSAMNINRHEVDTTGLQAVLDSKKSAGNFVLAVKMPLTTTEMYWVGDCNGWDYSDHTLQFTQLTTYPGWWYGVIPTAVENTGVAIYRDEIDGLHEDGIDVGSLDMHVVKGGITNLYFAYFKVPAADWGTSVNAYVWKGETIYLGSWPGTSVEQWRGPDGEGRREFRLKLFTNDDLTGAKIQWNTGSDTHKTGDLNFVSNGFYDGNNEAAANPVPCHAFRIDHPENVTTLSFLDTDTHPAVLQFTITDNTTHDKAVLGTIDLDCRKGVDTHRWVREQYIWKSTWTTNNFTIAVEDITTSTMGNDFALDRIMFQMKDNSSVKPLMESQYTIVKHTYAKDTSAVICQDDEFEWKGHTGSGHRLYIDGQLVSTIPTDQVQVLTVIDSMKTVGCDCDSVVTLQLTIKSKPKQLDILDWSEDVKDVCASVTDLRIHFETDGSQYSYALLKKEAGVPTYDNAAWSAYEDLPKDTTFMLDISSCEKDIPYTMHLRVKSSCDIQTPVYSDFIWHSDRTGDTTAVACGAFVWYGVEYTTTQKVTHTFTSVETKCDSIVTLDLTITPVDERQDTTVYWCGTYTWYGHDYESPCDTMVYFSDDCYKRMLHLKTLPAEKTIDTVACGVFDWNGIIYHQSQTIVETLESDVTHCDSVVTLHLTVLNDSLMYTKWGNLVLCADRNRDIASYQWYINGAEVPGATGQYFTGDDRILTEKLSVRAITQTGDTLYSCEKTFAEMTTSPDQSKEEYTLPQNGPVRVYSISGRLLHTAEGNVNDVISHLPAGIYILRYDDKSFRYVVY